MNFLKKLGCAAALSMAFTSAAYAAPVLNNWTFNPAGTGFAAGVNINESLTITGDAFIQLSGTTPGNFSFREHAVFNVPYGDNGATGPFGPRGNITATFEATGTGTFGVGSTNGSFQFDAGVIRMYRSDTFTFGTTQGIYGSNVGELIAEFQVLQGGGGQVDANGSPINNGQVTVNARAGAGALDAGYFFSGDGTDLSEAALLAFAFTNANTTGQPSGNMIGEIACQYASFSGPGCPGGTYANVPGQYFFVGNNGQFKLGLPEAEVPEPGSLALLGIAMLGAGVASRKRVKKA
ncbi:flocculation-associated PEP-CTERM protein PepA [Massilia puerhi]|uniref:flocculation-associated PEP-CTERM protein PepA n=1 Tax=Massilia puerhi TaxID=2681550 RepID=UPI0013578F23|nr:flocculation-associated PEP-CTERM protein PepA [Massilia puerhi]